jgi:hypothetical protein
MWRQQGEKRITIAWKQPAFQPRYATWAAGNSRPISQPLLALAGLEALLGLVDHVDPALAADEAVVTVTPAQGLERITDFHGVTFEFRAENSGSVGIAAETNWGVPPSQRETALRLRGVNLAGRHEKAPLEDRAGLS